MSTLDDLARHLSRAPAQTPAMPSSPVTGGVASVTTVNRDGTLTVYFNGANVPCQPLGDFYPAQGQLVAIIAYGTQIFAFGPATGGPPLFQNWSGAQGPLGTGSSGYAGTAFSFTISSTAKVRMMMAGAWSVPSNANQSLVLTQIIDGATMDVGGGFTGQMDLPVTPYAKFMTIGTKLVQPGTHTVGYDFTVGGGGVSVTLADFYIEVQQVG